MVIRNWRSTTDINQGVRKIPSAYALLLDMQDRVVELSIVYNEKAHTITRTMIVVKKKKNKKMSHPLQATVAVALL